MVDFIVQAFVAIMVLGAVVALVYAFVRAYAPTKK